MLELVRTLIPFVADAHVKMKCTRSVHTLCVKIIASAINNCYIVMFNCTRVSDFLPALEKDGDALSHVNCNFLLLLKSYQLNHYCTADSEGDFIFVLLSI